MYGFGEGSAQPRKTRLAIQENKRLDAATTAADMATIRMTETDSLNSC